MSKPISVIYFKASNMKASDMILPVNEDDNPCSVSISNYFTEKEIKKRDDTNSLILINEPAPDGSAKVISTDTVSDELEKAIIKSDSPNYIADTVESAIIDEFINVMDMNILTIIHSEFNAFVEQFLDSNNKNAKRDFHNLMINTSFKLSRNNIKSFDELSNFVFDKVKGYEFNKTVVNAWLNIAVSEIIEKVSNNFTNYIYNIMAIDALDYRQLAIDTGVITSDDKDVSDYTCYSLVFSLLHSIAKGCCNHIYELALMNSKYLATKIINCAEQFKPI